MPKDSKSQKKKRANREAMKDLRKQTGLERKPRSEMTEDELEDWKNERNRRRNRRAKLAKKLKASRKK